MMARFLARRDDDLDEWRVYREVGDECEPVARCFDQAMAERIARALTADDLLEAVKAGWNPYPAPMPTVTQPVYVPAVQFPQVVSVPPVAYPMPMWPEGSIPSTAYPQVTWGPGWQATCGNGGRP